MWNAIISDFNISFLLYWFDAWILENNFSEGYTGIAVWSYQGMGGYDMQLSDMAITKVNQAKSPEEAYREFVGLVSQGLGQVLADSLAQVLASTSSAANNGAIVGWEKYVKGLAMHMVWGTPGYDSPSVSLLTTASAVIGTTAKPTIAGGTITIGGSWDF